MSSNIELPYKTASQFATADECWAYNKGVRDAYHHIRLNYALTSRESLYRCRDERYKRLKEEHRCVHCAEQDERTLRGLTECAICAKKYHGGKKNEMQSK